MEQLIGMGQQGAGQSGPELYRGLNQIADHHRDEAERLQFPDGVPSRPVLREALDETVRILVGELDGSGEAVPGQVEPEAVVNNAIDNGAGPIPNAPVANVLPQPSPVRQIPADSETRSRQGRQDARPRQSAQRGNQAGTARACFECGDSGHIARACPLRARGEITCRNCRGVGHIARVCPTRQAARADPPAPAQNPPAAAPAAAAPAPPAEQAVRVAPETYTEKYSVFPREAERWRFDRAITYSSHDITHMKHVLYGCLSLGLVICILLTIFVGWGGVLGTLIMLFAPFLLYLVCQPLYCCWSNYNVSCTPAYTEMRVPWIARFLGGRLYYCLNDWFEVDWDLDKDLRTDRTRIGTLLHQDARLANMWVKMKWFGITFGRRRIPCSIELVSQLLDAHASNDASRALVYERMQRVCNSSFSINIPRHKLLAHAIHAGTLEVAFSAYLGHREILEAIPGFHRGAPAY